MKKDNILKKPTTKIIIINNFIATIATTILLLDNNDFIDSLAAIYCLVIIFSSIQFMCNLLEVQDREDSYQEVIRRIIDEKAQSSDIHQG